MAEDEEAPDLVPLIHDDCRMASGQTPASVGSLPGGRCNEAQGDIDIDSLVDELEQRAPKYAHEIGSVQTSAR